MAMLTHESPEPDPSSYRQLPASELIRDGVKYIYETDVETLRLPRGLISEAEGGDYVATKHDWEAKNKVEIYSAFEAMGFGIFDPIPSDGLTRQYNFYRHPGVKQIKLQMLEKMTRRLCEVLAHEIWLAQKWKEEQRIC